MLQIFLKKLARKYRQQLILLFVDGAGNRHSDELEAPDNVMLHLLPPYSPELDPQEKLWDEMREKILKNYALKRLHEEPFILCRAYDFRFVWSANRPTF